MIQETIKLCFKSSFSYNLPFIYIQHYIHISSKFIVYVQRNVYYGNYGNYNLSSCLHSLLIQERRAVAPSFYSNYRIWESFPAQYVFTWFAE